MLCYFPCLLHTLEHGYHSANYGQYITLRPLACKTFERTKTFIEFDRDF